MNKQNKLKLYWTRLFPGSLYGLFEDGHLYSTDYYFNDWKKTCFVIKKGKVMSHPLWESKLFEYIGSI
jgi:hypothetical protein